MGSLGSCRDVPVSAGVAAASTYAISKRNRLISRTDNVTNFVRTKLRNTAVKVNGRLPFKVCHRYPSTAITDKYQRIESNAKQRCMAPEYRVAVCNSRRESVGCYDYRITYLLEKSQHPIDA